MKKYEKDCLITLKFKMIKGYNFSEEFIKNNEELIEELDNFFDELYKNSTCVIGASYKHENNLDIKQRLFNILEKFFYKNIRIKNGYDEKTYTNINVLKNYILGVDKNE